MPRTTFTEKFDVADQDLDGLGGWVSGEPGVGSTGEVTIIENVAVNKVGGVQSAAAQTATVATGEASRVRAHVVCFSQDADARILVGLSYAGSPDFSIVNGGYGVVLDFSGYTGLDPIVLMKIVWMSATDLFAGTDVTQPLDVTALLNVDPAVPTDTAALSVTQLVHLTALPVDGGIRLRAYLNNEDIDAPNLEVTHSIEGKVSRSWMFAFDQHSLAGDLGVAFIEGEDLEDPTTNTLRIGDAPTVREVTRGAVDRYSGNTDVSDERLMKMARDTMSDIFNELGSGAWWMRPTESVTFEIVDGIGYAPEYVDEVFSLRDPVNNQTIGYNVIGTGNDGRLQLEFYRPHLYQSSTGELTYKMRYLRRWEQPTSMSDLMPIPRKFSELVEVGIARRIALDNPETTNTQMWDGEYARLLRQVKLSAAKWKRQNSRRLHVPTVRHDSRYYIGTNRRGY